VYGYIWTLGFITSGYYKLILPLKSKIRFTFFISLLFSFIPQIIISIIRKTGSKAGSVSRKYSCEDYGILTCLILMAIFNTTFSFQMVKNDSSLANAISLTFEFAFVRTFFYIIKSMVI